MDEEKLVGLNKFKILTAYHEIKEAQKGNMPIPRTVEFFISNNCHHSCIGCHSKMLHGKGILEIKKAKELLDELAKIGVEGIEISGGGEPLLHPNIIEFIEHAYSCGFKVGMFTNGTLITDKMLPTLTKLLFIRIALDAGTKETYKKIHGVDQFDRLVKNIKMIVAYRKKYNMDVTIGLKYLIYHENKDDIIIGAKLAKDLKVDYIQYKPVRHSIHAIQNTFEVEYNIKIATKYTDEKFKVLGGLQKTNIEQRCILNFLHPVIDASGDVFLCTFWKHRKNTHKIGNIFKQTFEELWYSERHRKAFMSTKVKECNIWDCPFHYPNYIAQEAIIKDKMHTEFI